MNKIMKVIKSKPKALLAIIVFRYPNCVSYFSYSRRRTGQANKQFIKIRLTEIKMNFTKKL